MAELKLTQHMTRFVEDTTQTVSAMPQRLHDMMPQRLADAMPQRLHDMMPQRLLDASRGAFGTTREEAEELMERGEDLFEQLVERGQEIEDVQISRLSGWWKEWSQRGRDQIQVAEEQLEHQIQAMLRTLHIPSSDDIKRLDAEIDRIAKKLDMQLTERELAALPIVNYKGMNVKEVLAQLDSLDEASLMAVQRFEMAHHNRKTIVREIEQRLEAMKA